MIQRLIILTLRLFIQVKCPRCGAYTGHSPNCVCATRYRIQQRNDGFYIQSKWPLLPIWSDCTNLWDCPVRKDTLEEALQLVAKWTSPDVKINHYPKRPNVQDEARRTQDASMTQDPLERCLHPVCSASFMPDDRRFYWWRCGPDGHWLIVMVRNGLCLMPGFSQARKVADQKGEFWPVPLDPPNKPNAKICQP